MDRIMMPLGDVPESLHEDLAGQMIYLKEDLVPHQRRAYQDTERLGSPTSWREAPHAAPWRGGRGGAGRAPRERGDAPPGVHGGALTRPSPRPTRSSYPGPGGRTRWWPAASGTTCG